MSRSSFKVIWPRSRSKNGRAQVCAPLGYSLIQICIQKRHIPPGVILAVNGDPGICSSANLTLTLYSPGSVGRYDAEHVPSLLSTHVS